MSDFYENPFYHDTPVTIFTSGSEADDWFHRNCDKCVYNDKCGLQKAMLNSLHDFYCVVPLHIAKRIGIDYNPLYQQGLVGVQCREYRQGDEPF